jgi:uncharacterized protein YllA (UPF0747 family)
MQRLDVEMHELHDLPALERRLAMASMPPSVATAWRQLQEQLHGSIQELGDAVTRESLMPPAVIEGLERSLGQKLGRAERRLLAAVKRKDEHTRRDLMVAASALFPLGKRQERVLSYVPMLTRGGDDLLSQMRAAATAHAQALVRAPRAETVAAR